MSKNNKAELASVSNASDTLPSEDSDDPGKLAQYSKSFHKISDENFSLKEKNSHLRHQLSTKKEFDKLIWPSARNAFCFMCVYAFGVALLLILQGFQLGGFCLPENVLVFLVGSTAATVIGLVGMVLTGVFIGARK